MKTLLKFAMGAAIAGALVNMLMKQRSGKEMDGSQDDLPAGDMSTSGGPEASYDQNAGSQPGTFTVQELIAEPIAGDPDAPQAQRGWQQ